MWIDSTAGEGTRVRILWPKAEGEPESVKLVSPVAVSGNETLLLVDDEAALRQVIRPGLERHGYNVLEASSGEEALEVAARGAGRIDMLVTDLVMGGMSGKDLAVELRRRHPGIPVLFISGYSHEAQDPDTLIEGSAEFLAKPFDTESLLRRVRSLIDRRVPTKA
jgi:DNA-binding response OmpR family regulator